MVTRFVAESGILQIGSWRPRPPKRPFPWPVTDAPGVPRGSFRGALRPYRCAGRVRYGQRVTLRPDHGQAHPRTAGGVPRRPLRTAPRVGFPYAWSVIPGPRPVRPRARSLVLATISAFLLAAGLVAGGCTSAPAATFDPAGPCVTDGKTPGAYPELEALLATELDGDPPTTVDSGRNCTPRNLGSLAAHDVSEVRFAGAVWDLGGSRGVTTAVFAAPGLEAGWVAEFYETSAEVGRKTEDIETSSVSVAGRPGQRIDLRNGESLQSVVVWPSRADGTVNVVLAADVDEATLQGAVEALEIAAR